jgi:hypothetical protein
MGMILGLPICLPPRIPPQIFITIEGITTRLFAGKHQAPIVPYGCHNVLSNHTWDIGWDRAKKPKGKGNKADQPDQHESGKDASKSTEALNFQQMEGHCYKCSEKGHTSRQCKKPNIPVADWAINRTPELKKVANIKTIAHQHAPPSHGGSPADTITSDAADNVSLAMTQTTTGVDVTNATDTSGW